MSGFSKEIKESKIYRNEDWLQLRNAIDSDEFKYPIFDLLLKPNDYLLNTKDIAVTLNMGVRGHSNDSFIGENLIDAAFYISSKIKERVLLDSNLLDVFKLLNKNVMEFNKKDDRQIIDAIFQDNKQLYLNYFNLFNNSNYNEKIKIYHPGLNKSWIDWEEENSLDIHINMFDIRRGFFLPGFDYKSENKGWLQIAIRVGEKEYYNPNEKNELNGKLVWIK